MKPTAKHLLDPRRWSRRRAVIVCSAVAVVGVLTAVWAFAAGVPVAVEAADGTLSGGATKVTDSGASGSAAAPPGIPSPTAPAPTPTATPLPHLATVKIWPIGDSITEGQRDENKNGYRLALWNALAALGYTIDYVGDYNYGLPPLPDMDTNGSGGSCILANPCNPADILYNITNQSMPRLNPDIIIMNGGANDFCCDNPQDPVRVEGYMQQWIQRIWTIKPNAYLIVLGLTGDYHPEYDSWMQQYATQQAALGKHIGYVNIANVTTNDTVHPDNPGYQQISDRILPIIKPMLHELTGR